MFLTRPFGRVLARKIYPKTVKPRSFYQNYSKMAFTSRVKPYSYTGRIRVKEVLNSQREDYLNKTITICGWTRTIRYGGKGAFSFLEINDGSCFKNLQVVIDKSINNFDQLKSEGVGTSFKITGTLVESPKKGQKYELSLRNNEDHSFKILGSSPQGEYPLAKKRHTLEYLRGIQHLRPRTNTIGAVTRIRNSICKATHDFFQDRGFLYIHTPIITSSDCEGAGELFHVKTQQEESENSENFFKDQVFLTVSGQLDVENYACSLSDVYTFGPTFRAENSHTKRHLSEFWMIEPELAFSDLNDCINCAEDYLKHNIEHVLVKNMEDLEFCNQWVKKGIIDDLNNILQQDFERIPYTDAISELASQSKNKFEVYPEWGIDLSTEHEKFLCEINQKPVIVYDYPKQIKPFYMRQNDDGKTVAAMDVLVPGVGELIGGSQREERYEVLKNNIEQNGISPEEYWWYLDLRKYGSVPHSGFGAGLERLVMTISGIDNIRDSIPFPRWPGNAKY
ncbi:unnamed protein product [Moneuplotes crassus]|uniref:asparagine--tRNA ligase n=1 Tax=Euplotes crassus TaxID=5936 RepID=A0AAD1UCS9_EUPCR|nr:unnamed protein product [Moneuplotes crassus]